MMIHNDDCEMLCHFKEFNILSYIDVSFENNDVSNFDS